jgi:predicted MPP superfamily phosphohydrolase
VLVVLRIALSLVLFSGLSYYVWRRLVHRTGLRGAAKIAATSALVLCVAPLILVSIASAGKPPTVAGALAYPVYIGWALFALTFAGVLVSDIVRLFAWALRKSARRERPVDPARRQALARLTGGLVVAAAAGEVAVGLKNAAAGPALTRVPIDLPRLPPAFDGFSIVQLTDVHIGGTIDRAFIERLVAQANAAAPDLIVLTGDLVDGSVEDLGHAAAPLADLKAPHGVFAVTGNHEYYSGADAWIVYLRSLGITVLRNQRVELRRDDAVIDLVGIDDHGARSFGGDHGPDLARALAGRDPTRAALLLAHQPRQVHDAARHGIDLQISGHTHGGQVWPWHYLVSLQQGGLLAGRYRVGATELYVSRGAGHWGPPMRVGAPAELTHLTLRRRAIG